MRSVYMIVYFTLNDCVLLNEMKYRQLRISRTFWAAEKHFDLSEIQLKFKFDFNIMYAVAKHPARNKSTYPIIRISDFDLSGVDCI